MLSLPQSWTGNPRTRLVTAVQAGSELAGWIAAHSRSAVGAQLARSFEPSISADQGASEPSGTDAKVGNGGSTPLAPTIWSVWNSEPGLFANQGP